MKAVHSCVTRHTPRGMNLAAGAARQAQDQGHDNDRHGLVLNALAHPVLLLLSAGHRPAAGRHRNHAANKHISCSDHGYRERKDEEDRHKNYVGIAGAVTRCPQVASQGAAESPGAGTIS